MSWLCIPWLVVHGFGWCHDLPRSRCGGGHRCRSRLQPLMRLAHMNLHTCLCLGGEVTLVTLVCLVWLGDSRFGSHRLGSRLGCHGGECHWVIHWCWGWCRCWCSGGWRGWCQHCWCSGGRWCCLVAGSMLAPPLPRRPRAPRGPPARSSRGCSRPSPYVERPSRGLAEPRRRPAPAPGPRPLHQKHSRRPCGAARLTLRPARPRSRAHPLNRGARPTHQNSCRRATPARAARGGSSRSCSGCPFLPPCELTAQPVINERQRRARYWALLCCAMPKLTKRGPCLWSAALWALE